MKKLSAFLVGLSLIAGAAMAANVSSINAVGYVNTPIYPGFNLVSFSWTAVGGGGGVALSNAFAGQLTGNTDVSTADNIILWNPQSQRYEACWKYDDGSVQAWLDGSGDYATNTIANGDAFWVLNRHSTTQSVVMAGEVVNVTTNSRVFVHGFNFFGYPFSCGQSITNLAIVNNGAYGTTDVSTSDNIIAWDHAANRYKAYWLYDDGSVKAWLDQYGDFATNMLDMGQGFWYLRRGVGAFTWSEPKPYTL